MIRAGGSLQEQNAGSAERFRGANHRPGVARILQTVQHHYQAGAAENLLRGPLGGPHQGHDPLAGLGRSDRLKKRVGQHHGTGGGQSSDLPIDGFAQTFGGEDDGHLAAAAKRLFEQMKTFGDAEAVRVLSPREWRGELPATAGWQRS